MIIGIAVGISFYKKLDPAWLRFLVWFLIFTLLTQLAGFFYSYYYQKSNHFIFNIFIFIQFLFYFFLFYKAFEQPNLRSFVILMGIFFMIYFFYRIFSGSGLWVFQSDTNTTGSICVVICCLLYLVSLFNSDKVINYFRMPVFWIVTGLLFYFAGTIIYLGLVNYINKNNLDNGAFYNLIMTTLDCLLYGLFTFGFISNQVWKRKT